MLCLNVKENAVSLRNKEYILDSIILLVIIQIARVIIKYILLSQFNLTLENLNIINIISIIIVGVSAAFIFRGNDLFNSAGQRLIKLNNKYTNKKIRLVSGFIGIMGLCIAPYFKGGYLSSNLIILTLYLIVQPIFEEILFREYIWNYIGSFEKDEKKVLSSYFTVDIIMPKVFFGLIVAFVLGIIKIKYKDTYLCIFAHSLINIIFGK